jgi:subtilase family serine protease
MLFHRARHSARQGLRSPKSPPRPQRVRPQLEELETRNLLSASTATPAVDPSATSTSQTATSTTNTTTTSTTNSAWASQTAQPDVTATPLGATPNAGSGGYVYYTPAQIRQAYGIDQTTLPNGQAATGAGQTIAIVDAYNDPNIANDLATFDAGYGLAAPPSFQVVRMNGVTQSNSGWSYETSLDVEWAHAVAPGANILLVETPSNSYSDLLAGVQYAASQPGVVAVSMSWGGSEFYNETSLDSSFTTPAGHVGGSGLPGGVTFVASSGDSGAWSGAQWPASSPDVLAVGGTSLYLDASNNYSSESAWLYGGGGYSHYEWEPSFQQGVQNSGWRTSPDVSYDANPYTGFVVYNSLDLPSGASGWWLEGGTSAGAPQWAGIMALADQARAANGLGSLGNGQQEVYSLPSSDFHPITSGTNGYQATSGYNMATGLGSPIVNRIVADLAGLAGANSTTQTGLYSGTTGSTTRPLDTTAGLPIAGTQTGAGGGSTASADPAAETLLPASSLTPGQETLPASIVESPSPAGMMLTPAANQAPPGVIECPSAPPSNPATDAVFINLGATGWLPAAVSDEVTPELTASLLQGQAGEAPLLDAAAADGGEAANA